MLWECSCKSNVNLMHRVRSKALKMIEAALQQKQSDRLEKRTNKVVSVLTTMEDTKLITR